MVDKVELHPLLSQVELIIENSDVYDFELSTEEVARINELNQNHRMGADPDNLISSSEFI
ncbi:hypothetical protein MHH52_13325 [Paenibacillus sp. FSL K6-0276]|uniref:hypothetical protein n=1 Tax=Paenibacillus sp. FSL K6-0276 TaxID=2921450 RepID=UPI0030EF3AB9